MSHSKHFDESLNLDPAPPGLTKDVHPAFVGPLSPICVDPETVLRKLTAKGLTFDTNDYWTRSYERVGGSTRPEDPFKEILNDARGKLLRLVGRRSAGPTFSEEEMETVTLFSNTTAAMERVLWTLRNTMAHGRPTLLTTDLEYPSIMACADECWRGPICIVQLSDLFHDWSKDQSTEVFSRLLRAVRINRPDVILLSHVDRHFGYRLGWRKGNEQNCADLGARELLEEFARLDPQPIVILDGAQTLGNIRVDLSDSTDDKPPKPPKLWNLIDFYIASGHKWLCGRPTVGIAFAKKKWFLKSQAQSLAGSLGIGGTADLDAVRILANSLMDFKDFNNNGGPEALHSGLKRKLTVIEGLGDNCWYLSGAFVGLWSGRESPLAKQLDVIQEMAGEYGRLKAGTWVRELTSPPGALRYLLMSGEREEETQRVQDVSRRPVPRVIRLDRTGPLGHVHKAGPGHSDSNSNGKVTPLLVCRICFHWARGQREGKAYEENSGGVAGGAGGK